MPHDTFFTDVADPNDEAALGVQFNPVDETDAEIIHRYEAGVRRYCRSRTRTPEDAEDAVQDTFLRFLRRSDAHIRNKEAWLITAAWRACADINRKRRRDEEHIATAHVWDCLVADESEDIIDVHAENPEQFTVERLTIAALFRQMSPREVSVLTHVYLMGGTSQEVAKYLGVTEDHFFVIVSRARRHARALLVDMERTAPH